MDYLFLFLGLALLILSGEFLVRGAVGIALGARISTLVVGLTVVSFGTSAPELVVCIQAALSDHPDIAIGNIVGSNMANLGLVLGIVAILFPLSVNRNSLRIDWPVMMIASIGFFILILDLKVQFYEGIIYLIFLITYLTFLVRKSRKEQVVVADQTKTTGESKPTRALWINITLIILGSAGLVLGSHWFVGGAVVVARDFDVSEKIIGLSLVALGTSLPELVTSIIAGFKKEADLVIGNLIGSNIFNILAIGGITSIVHEIPVNLSFIQMDIYWMLGISLLILPLAFRGSRLGRGSGMILLSVYVVYMYLTFKG
ncbi:MAG: calcium/sodium antiporter [Bacteroidetes bacterium]|nr:calcium/sodium antiporter [Bacteroidota bacterium]